MEIKRLKHVGLSLSALLALSTVVRFRQTEVASGESYVKPNSALKHVAMREKTAHTDMTSVPICTSQERLSYINEQLMTQPVDGHLLLVVADPQRVAYCLNKKVASATLWHLMYALGGNSSFNVSAVPEVKLHHANARRHGPPQRLVDAKSLNTIKGYRRFAVIRNPLDRLVSAYNHVILTLNDSISRRKFNEWSQAKPSNGTLFQRFTKAVLDGLINHHWLPQAVRCDFQAVKYDDVIRIESFRHDFEPFVTDYLKSNWSVLLDETDNVLRGNKTAPRQTSVTPRYLPIFQEIPKEELLQLKNYYRDDFRLFGYDFDVDTLMASCSIRTVDGRVCC